MAVDETHGVESGAAAPVAPGSLWKGRYEPLEMIGAGSQGQVYRARDHQHDRIVALKVRPVGSPDERAALLSEARILLGLRPHAGVPLVRDDFFLDERYVIVMDWIEGINLAAVLEQRGDPGLATGTVVAYLSQVAEALDHLHGHEPPIVHGDVKPANCVLTADGRVVLVDFGISSWGGERRVVGSGTRGYLAPEVAAGDRPSPAADIFGLAATTFALLDGRAPDSAGDLPTGANPLAAAVRRGLAIDPARRPASAGELVQRLRSRHEGDLPVGVITFMLTDIEGSTAMWDASPAAMEQALARHEAVIADVVDTHRGRLIKSAGEGDATLSVFVRATDGVLAALELQRALAAEPWPETLRVRVRISLHTGEAQLRDGDYFGTTVNRAARLRALAVGGQVVLSQATHQLIADQLPTDVSLRDLGRHRLTGLSRDEHVFGLIHADLEVIDVPRLPTMHNLPAATTSLVGRADETAQVVDLITQDDVRIVTITGPGGVGKSRLAIAASEASAGAFRDGVRFVALAPVAEPDLVASAIADAVGLPELPGQPRDLVLRLREMELLLILDNFEQLLPAATVIDRLVSECPGISILVTSQATLGLRAERVFPLAGLPLPPSDASLDELRSCDVVELFEARAHDAEPGFVLTADNAETIGTLCRRLDGLPLAIELLAPRLKLFSPDALLERLDRRFVLLRGGGPERASRHQTLEAAIEWSYDLLDESERAVFRSLSVFVGGFTVEAAEYVGDDLAAEFLDAFTSLVDKSLIVMSADPQGEKRASMLESIRAFGLKKLNEHGEADDVRARHSSYFLVMAQAEAPRLVSAQRDRSLERMASDVGNLRAALEELVASGTVDEALELAASLGWFWYHRGQYHEGRQLLDQALAAPSPSPPVRGRALTAAARLAYYAEDLEPARTMSDEAIVLARDHGDASDLAYALLVRALVAQTEGDSRSGAFASEAVDQMRSTGDRWGLALTIFYRAVVRVFVVPREIVLAEFAESEAMFRELADGWGVAGCLVYRGRIAQLDNEHSEAKGLLEASIEELRPTGDRFRLLTALEMLGAVTATLGEDSGSLYAEATSLRHELGMSAAPVADDSVKAVPLPPLLTRSEQFAFVGRVAERELLGDAWNAASNGERRVVLLAGEPGAGKTRLASEFARAAHAGGALVLGGRCDEEVGISYQPFVEALGWYVANAIEPAIDALSERVLSELSRLLPEVRERIPGIAEPPSTDPDAERYLLFGAVTAALTAIASDAPTVLILDDLHWADKSTVLLLRHLAMTLGGAEVLIVGTYRDTDLTSAHPLTDGLASLRREPGVERIEIAGLDQRDVVALLEDLTGFAMDKDGIELAHAVWHETDGNPFFTREVLKHLSESGVIGPAGDGWLSESDLSSIRLPDSVREVVRQRTRRLGDEVQEILTQAAVIGQDFDLALLSDLSDREDSVVLEALECAERGAIITEVEGRSERYAFTHALFQHSLYSDTSSSRRARMHRRIGELLAIECGEAPGDRIRELARHWLAAPIRTSSAKAAAYARRAGEHALDALAPEEAIRWFGQAIERLDAESPGDAAEWLDVMIGLGNAQRHAGEPAFRETLIAAANEATRVGDTDRLVAIALANQRGLVSSIGTVDGERIVILERALAAVGESDSQARALLLATLAAELTFAGTLPRVRAVASEAESIARRLGDDGALVRVLNLTFMPLWVPDTLRRTLEASAEALALAGRVGDPVARFWAAMNRLHAMASSADRDGIDTALALAAALAHEIGQPFLTWQVPQVQCPHVLLVGDAVEAERLANEALQIGMDSGQPDALAVFGGNLVGIRLHQGRLDEILPLIEQAAADNPGIPGFQAAYALMLCECDRIEEARPLLEEARLNDFHLANYDFNWLTTTTLWADVAASLANLPAAELLYERLSPFETQGVTAGGNFTGTVGMYLARLAAVLGHDDEGRQLFASADTQLRDLRAPFWRARNQVDWARFLIARGDERDEQESQALLDAALVTAVAYGCAGVERRALSVRSE